MKRCRTLQLDEQAQLDVRNRLLSIRGHLDGLLKMLGAEHPYCIDVLRQIKAIQAALDRVGERILKSHLHDHVVTAHERGDADEIVNELLEVLKYR